MLENTDGVSSTQNKNKKLGFWFWLFVVFAVICAIMFVGAAISLLGVIFPGVFGGLSAVISNIPWIADVFGSILSNITGVVLMPIAFAFCVYVAKKEIKSHTPDKNEYENNEEDKKTNGEDKNKIEHENENNKDSIVNEQQNENKMGDENEKNKNEEQNKNDVLNATNNNDSVNNKNINNDNGKENENMKRDEIKEERKPMRTVGEIADVFLEDTLDLMSDSSLTLNGNYLINGPKLLDDWAYGKLYDQLHGQLPGKISENQMRSIVGEKRAELYKKDLEYRNKVQERELQEREGRNKKRAEKQILPKMENHNENEKNGEDENKNP